ncbi:MAG: hypothetical protein WC490_02955 [Candidatus Margulisiibacteriota bacterium]
MEDQIVSQHREDSSNRGQIRFSASFSQRLSGLSRSKQKVQFLSLSELSKNGFSRSAGSRTVH